MIPAYYVDTSVLGGYFDEEFREATREWWSALLHGRWHALVSTLTVDELAKAPAEVRGLLEDLPAANRRILAVTEEAEALAGHYLDARVLGSTGRGDALHVAVATLSTAKAIVSWNFRHLVNLRRVEGFNGVNLLMGYRPIDIRTPREVTES